MLTALLVVNGLLVAMALAGVTVWLARKAAAARSKTRRRIGWR